MKFLHYITFSLIFLLVSCNDFLEIDPQNEIIFEQFWNEKSDVESIIAGCYSKLASASTVKRMMIWGEFRSENIVKGAGLSPNTDSDLEKILLSQITASNTYCTWVDFYSVINTCNIVIKYAPTVAEKDPSYTTSELNAHIAEVSALRDLCYFYLIRTFRDVPYTTEAYIDDDQTFDLPATSFDDVLASLIADLVNVRLNAIQTYAVSSAGDENYQTCRITLDAIDALLCEMYLWQQDYDNCIEYADLVIGRKTAEAENNSSEKFSSSNDDFYGYPLTSEKKSNSQTDYGTAYNELFSKNAQSTEIIFSLNYGYGGDTTPYNDAVDLFYGDATNAGYVAPSSTIGEDVSEGQGNVFSSSYDIRNYLSFSGSSPYVIDKYRYASYSLDFKSSTNPDLNEPSSTGLYNDGYNESNWIIYRLTDVMLLKAEALAQKCKVLSDPDFSQCRDTVLKIVNAVYKRAMCRQTVEENDLFSSSGVSLSGLSLNTPSGLEDLVEEERHRDLLFEGKRWYDLVRRSRRDSSTDHLVDNSLRKYSSGTASIRDVLKKLDAMYWPYHIDEIKLNSNLIQNPVFSSGTNSSYEQSK